MISISYLVEIKPSMISTNFISGWNDTWFHPSVKLKTCFDQARCETSTLILCSWFNSLRIRCWSTISNIFVSSFQMRLVGLTIWDLLRRNPITFAESSHRRGWASWRCREKKVRVPFNAESLLSFHSQVKVRKVIIIMSEALLPESKPMLLAYTRSQHSEVTSLMIWPAEALGVWPQLFADSSAGVSKCSCENIWSQSPKQMFTCICA